MTPHITSTEGFVVAVSHFVERHGLVVIVALGESIVVIGAGGVGLALDGALVLAALLALSLSAALWWVYFSDEEAVERALHAAAPERRPELALRGFGYWRDPLNGWIAVGLAGGAALFIVCDVGFRRTFGLERNRTRLAAAAAAVATIPLGTEVGAAAQVGALAALVMCSLAVESVLASGYASRRPPMS